MLDILGKTFFLFVLYLAFDRNCSVFWRRNGQLTFTMLILIYIMSFFFQLYFQIEKNPTSSIKDLKPPKTQPINYIVIKAYWSRPVDQMSNKTINSSNIYYTQKHVKPSKCVRFSPNVYTWRTAKHVWI